MLRMSTLRNIFIITSRRDQSDKEVTAAINAFNAMGFHTRHLVMPANGGPDAPAAVSKTAESGPDAPGTLEEELAAYDTLCIADDSDILSRLKEIGAAAAGYAHEGNRSDKLSGAEYILAELPYIDEDSLVKIWQRQRNLPWTILETRRCTVREFVPEDMEAIAALYDGDARQFLEPPGDDMEKEREILRAYIERIYRLYGYGHWAVILTETGELIGRIGFSFPFNVEGLPPHDASLGYLVSAAHRHKGIAGEVCRALIQYGFEVLGFEAVAAETDISNTASQALLRQLGFSYIEESEGKRYYLKARNDNI